MNTLLNSKELIFTIKSKVINNDGSIYTHEIIQNCDPIVSISIVMTSSNRSKQTYFTLETIARCNVDRVNIILVDDSTDDPIKIEELQRYPFYIDLIRIIKPSKKWHNPLVNYNIGFKFVKGSKVIIQNAEVCHIGQTLNFVDKELSDNNYYVFDVKALNNFDANEYIYKSNPNTIEIYNYSGIWLKWYQHISRNMNYHFLTAMTRSTFHKIGDFSYDYTMGMCYDDDDYVLKIKSKGINIINLFHNEYKFGGIHLYHIDAQVGWDTCRELNYALFVKKTNIFNNTGIYIDVTHDINTFNSEYNKLL